MAKEKFSCAKGVSHSGPRLDVPENEFGSVVRASFFIRSITTPNRKLSMKRTSERSIITSGCDYSRPHFSGAASIFQTSSELAAVILRTI